MNLCRPRHAWCTVLPGRDVPTTEPWGRWYLVNGSSCAGALGDGPFALVRERHRPTAQGPVAARTGSGAIHACATMLRTFRACDRSCAVTRWRAAPCRREAGSLLAVVRAAPLGRDQPGGHCPGAGCWKRLDRKRLSLSRPLAEFRPSSRHRNPRL